MSITTKTSLLPFDGLEASPPPDISPPGVSTIDQFSTLTPPILDLFGNAISSPGSADGPTRSISLAGATGRFGPDHVPVSRFRARDSGEDMPTNDTSGPLFTASSPSAALQRSLESRLRARMDVNGSPEYALTWKHWDMQSGPLICALRASARRTSGSDCSGWPTPNAIPETRGGLASNPEAAMRRRTLGHMLNLDDAATLAGWPTPMAGNPGTDTYNPAGNTDSSRKTVALVAGWATPTQRDHKDGASTLENVPINGLLGRQVSLAGWATPATPSGGRSVSIDKMDATGRTPDGKKHTASLEHQVKFSGEMPAGSPASMEKRGALNPAFSRWLMGFPSAWCDCAVTAMPSSRK